MPLQRHYLLLAATVICAVVLGAIVAVWATRSSATDGGMQGDADCDGRVTGTDALADLRYTSELGPFAPCTQATGDTDCDGRIRAADALRILRYGTGLPPLSARAGCPAIGSRLTSPTATASSPASGTPMASAAQTPTPAPTTSGGPTPTITPNGTPAAGAYALSQVVPGAAFDGAIELAFIPGTDGQEALIATQEGLIYRVSMTGAFQPALYGDISGRLTSGDEQGLLSLAFSPDFETDHRLYLYYTRGSPQPSVLARYTGTATALDTNSETVLLEVPQPFRNHNGGHIVFGHDGYLYLSLGDGGSGGDPQGNGQNVNVLLGKVLRLDVSGGGYTSPPDNPFVNAGGRDEIYAYGLRNPWRMSIDRLTGDVWLGDVGQDRWEEVDHIMKGGNYGWRCREGLQAYNMNGCPQSGFQQPRAVYGHDDGQAVTGGYVYRGTEMPELYDWYVYADFYSGHIWAVDTASADSAPVLLTTSDHAVASFTETPDGELLIVTYSSGIFRLARS